jgi:hypothetical protein
MESHLSKQRFSMTLHCVFLRFLLRQCPLTSTASCVACKSLPVMINSPLVSSLKRQRTLSHGARNTPKPPLRHRLSVSFSPHVQVPTRLHSGNESDETLMGAGRPQSILRDSMVIDEKALPRTPKLERSNSVSSFATTAKTAIDNFEAVRCTFTGVTSY